ncbi:uncharacterized protein LOC113402645 isoform X1 [Vanessa tameamea]|uniref:Uncharacterized protein LOC113402645 isoform X1 n=2 Tax=Vanessa tameamea TaxID=334116 RepID=A0A8B8INN2_VANTA
MFIEMAPNLSKNTILKGCVSSDFFCLVCETYFTSSVQCEEHISGADHKEKMHSVKYVEEFKEDFIVKIKTKYFCELCNRLLPVFARVTMHIDEPSHIKEKYVGWLKRIDNVVVAFDSLIVDDTSWQGLGDNSCAICNMEYKDEDAHKNLPTHMLNLIQSEVKFDKNKNVYRKVDDHSIHCLTCNLMIQTLDTNHFDSPQHKQMVQVASNDYKALKQENDKSDVHDSKLKNNDINAPENDLAQQTVVDTFALNNQVSELLDSNSINTTDFIENSKIKPTYVDDNKSKEEVCDSVMDVSNAKEHVKRLHHKTILDMHKKCEQNKQMKNSTPVDDDSEQQNRTGTVLDSVDKLQSNGVNINFESQTAVSKICSMNLDFDHEAINKHKKQFKKGKKSVQFKLGDVPEKKETLVSSPVVVKPEFLKKPFEENSSKSEEVERGKDLNNAVSIPTPPHIETPPSPKIKKTKETTLEKIPAKDFIKTIVAAKYSIFKDVIINNKFCVNHFSFCFIKFLVDRVTMNCFICDKNILYTEFESHNDNQNHERAISDALVLTQCDQEFIREMRPGCFHCGYCNVFQTSWFEMEKHLKTSFHIDCKNEAFWRLQQYQPEISKNTDCKIVVDNLYTSMLTVKFL